MEPPSKRPRLSCFGSPSGDAELDVARYQNDLVLKTRFEQIFDKYSQDFEGIGDEIDLETGEIVLNNGHLERMINEKDIGQASARATDPYGASLLRAMTVAPEDPEYIYPVAQEVVQSIETIADNVIVISDSSSEDDLFDAPRSASLSSGGSSQVQDDLDDSSNHDTHRDSMPDARRFRDSSSPDSLFEMTLSPRHEIKPERSPSPQSTPNHQRRQLLREEIRNIMDEQREARVEEAWRIPVRVGPFPPPPQRASSDREAGNLRSKIVQRHAASDLADSQELNVRSLWAAPTRYRRTKKQIAADRARAEARAESVDPLQQEFTGSGIDSATDESEDEYRPDQPRKRIKAETKRRRRRGSASTIPNTSGAPGEPAEEQPAVVTPHELEVRKRSKEVVQSTAQGVCPYCKLSFDSRKGVLQHFDRWLLKSEKYKPTTDPHDHEVMRLLRPGMKPRPGQGPRLTFSDFRNCVELHEGFGMSFDKIAKSRVLRTRKTGLPLREIYDFLRNVPIPGHELQATTRWDPYEEQLMKSILLDRNPRMNKFKRQLVNKEYIDIGDKLAEIFVQELQAKHKGKLPSLDVAIAERRRQQSKAAEDDQDDDDNINQGSEEDVLFKQESDDDLSANQE